MPPEPVKGSCLCAAVSFEFKAPWFVETPDLPKFPEQP